MNPFDLVLLVLMVLLGVAGAVWGITRIAASLVGFFLAFLLALRLAGRGPDWLGGWIERPEWARLVAFFLVFFAVMILAAVAAFALRRFLKAVLLGWADRAGGAGVGAVAALLVGAALVVPLTALPPSDEPLLADSLLAPYALWAADLVRHAVPDDLAEQYREKSRALRDAWKEGTRRERSDDPQR